MFINNERGQQAPDLKIGAPNKNALSSDMDKA